MVTTLATTIRDLHRPRGRERRGLCLAEGVRLVEEVVATDLEILGAVVGPSLDHTARGQALRVSLAARSEVTQVSDEELTALAATDHPQGVVVVLRWKGWHLDDIAVGTDSVMVVLDAIQDPGNVGTIARTAWGLGAAGVVALPGTAELANPKTLRASMGAVFRFPTVSVDEATLARWLQDHGIAVVTAAGDGTPLPTARLSRPLALVLGNEGAGVQSVLGKGAAMKLAVPLATGVESLNVAVAAGILLYGVLRDR